MAHKRCPKTSWLVKMLLLTWDVLLRLFIAMFVFSAAKRPLLARVIICEPQRQVQIKMGHSLATLDYKIALIWFLRV